jgi:NAD(P)H-hydrate repair Nnr-like enzyme with NAD(P)H-hydrate epimerase domain
VGGPGGGLLHGAGIIVDAMFGSGLSRPLDGQALEMAELLTAKRLPVCAVDVPNGVDGATGRVLGTAAPADLTVTFFRTHLNWFYRTSANGPARPDCA